MCEVKMINSHNNMKLKYAFVDGTGVCACVCFQITGSEAECRQEKYENLNWNFEEWYDIPTKKK